MPTSCLFLALAAVTLTLTLAVGCDRQRTLTEDEAEEEFGADCDAIYDDCVAPTTRVAKTAATRLRTPVRDSSLALLIAVLVAFGLLVIPSHARAAVLCKKKSGVIAVRDACKGKETRLDPDALGLRGSQGPPGGLVLKDSTGAVIGTYFDDETNGAAWVVRSVGTQAAMLSIGRPGDSTNPPFNALGASNTGGPLYFASSDCSGQALMGQGTSGLLAGTTPGLGSLVYFLQGPRTLQNVNSYQAQSGSPCTMAGSQLYVVPHPVSWTPGPLNGDSRRSADSRRT